MEVKKEMSIREVLMLNPGTARIFMEFGMHCLGCRTPCCLISKRYIPIIRD